jgi:outer membrane biosynthesis protein TonB
MQGRKAEGQEGRKARRPEGRQAFLRVCLSALLPFCLSALPVLLTGCAHAQAKTTPDAPLDMPAPPPRDVEPNEAEVPPPVPLVPEPARSSAPVRPRPAPREQPRPEPPKPDAAPPPPEPPKPAEEPAKPPTTLQTAPATVESEQERAIRATLTRATSVLNRVDYRALSADARTQYDTAKRFIQQADEAMRTKNLVFARNLADKAAVLAAQLGGR